MPLTPEERQRSNERSGLNCCALLALFFFFIFMYSIREGAKRDGDDASRSSPTKNDSPFPSDAQAIAEGRGAPKPLSKKPLPRDLDAYRRKIAKATADAEDSLHRLSDASQEVGADPNLLADDQWKIRMALALAEMRESAKELENIHPVPAKMKKVNRGLKRMAATMRGVVSDMTYGIDNLDAFHIERASRRMRDISPIGEGVTRKLTDILAPYDF